MRDGPIVMMALELLFLSLLCANEIEQPARLFGAQRPVIHYGLKGLDGLSVAPLVHPDLAQNVVRLDSP